MPEEREKIFTGLIMQIAPRAEIFPYASVQDSKNRLWRLAVG
jgi:hypothetical protein